LDRPAGKFVDVFRLVLLRSKSFWGGDGKPNNGAQYLRGRTMRRSILLDDALETLRARVIAAEVTRGRHVKIHFADAAACSCW
jgi:hypothetical protein